MRRRRPQLRGPALPRGRRDALRQVLLFAAAYLLYELVRGLSGSADPARAAVDATRVIALERGLHVFVEPALQAWALHRPWLMDLAGWTYVGAHGAVTFGALAFLYLRRNASFYFVRNMFLIAMAIALVGYAVFPTAPPRLMPAWGFADPIRGLTGVNAERGPGSVLVNNFAAIPSMHVCFALMTGWTMGALVRARALKLAWRLYPVAIGLVVVVTGNHYLLDIALGTLTFGLAALLAAQLLGRARPEAWRLRPGASDRVPGLPDGALVP